MRCSCVLLLIAVPGLASAAAEPVLPTPQYFEETRPSLDLPPGSPVVIRVAPGAKIALGAEVLRDALAEADPSLKVSVQPCARVTEEAPTIHLWDFAADPAPELRLNFLDRQVLAPSHGYSQSYVVRTPGARSLWVIGNSDQGVLWGAMTVRQLIRRTARGVEIQGAYVRDYPDFEFRCAADWLLNVEINRWALDRGRGLEAFARLCERKIDTLLHLKINMVVMDGYGWGLDRRFSDYAALMRRLNRYARCRGISLRYGGYGAGYGLAYQGGPIYEDAPYLGEVFKNRERYPDGPTYRCMGFPARHTYAKGVDPAVLGTCRGNDELNRRKADELRRFVEAVEPGGLVIHHEDFGGFEGTQTFWRERCERCRARWPSDALAARGGGAGALAHGYTALVHAVNGVRNRESGYDAARDCQITLVSPVYSPESPASDDWSEVLELWQNIALELPRAENVQVGFREVFPQRHGAGRWTQRVADAMHAVGVRMGVDLFFVGGADTFLSDYPLTGAPSLNAAFLGARTIYNFSGDFYGEPMAAINAEYAWNALAPGSRDPSSCDEAFALRHKCIYEVDQPEAIFRPGGLYDRACQLLYGAAAGPVMAAFYRQSAWIPDVEITAPKTIASYYRDSYLPATWNRAFAVPTHWRHLAIDSKTWGPEIDNERYLATLRPLKIDRCELHRRLARRWSVVAELNAEGARHVDRALAAGSSHDSRDDLEFLQDLFRVYQPFAEALAEFHRAFHLYLARSGDPGAIAGLLGSARVKGDRARALAAEAFPLPLDPSGGEVGSLRRLVDRFLESNTALQHTVARSTN